MLKPNYNQSIVNLTATISAALGGSDSGYSPLADLADMDLASRPLAFMVIDGMGASFLDRFPTSFLAQHCKARLTSVYPTTTATAITSFFTGVAPQQHAITGWHTYLRELGTVATALPFVPRYHGESFATVGVSPGQIITSSPLLDTINRPCHVVLPHYLADSPYSRFLCGTAQRHSYERLAELFALISQLAATQPAPLVTAYWAGLDSMGHSHGIASEEVADHFEELDRQCAHALPSLAQSGVNIVITADHGLIDTDEAHTVRLDDHPELAATLTLPLCGDSRCAYCYVRSDKREEFERYVKEKLRFACDLKKSAELLAQGYFGKGEVSPRLCERIGEYTLAMKENYVIRDRLLTEKPFSLIGVHGGLSEQELYVPLICLAE